MRFLAWYDEAGARRTGIVAGERVRLVEGEAHDHVTTGTTVARADLHRPAPPVQPRAIVCVGLNYRDHAAESGLAVPDRPALFTKLTHTVIAPGEPIILPVHLSEDIDFEAELGVVIGRRASRVDAAEALDHVLGYTCVNDVSARDLQATEGFGWVRGKSADTFCPVGPELVTADEIADPQALRITCDVSGERLQDSSTSDMIFPVAEIVSFISQAVTLHPGDLICTGTPSGVGMARTPRRWLRAGDTVRVEIEGIGALENPVVASGAGQ